MVNATLKPISPVHIWSDVDRYCRLLCFTAVLTRSNATSLKRGSCAPNRPRGEPLPPHAGSRPASCPPPHGQLKLAFGVDRFTQLSSLRGTRAVAETGLVNVSPHRSVTNYHHTQDPLWSAPKEASPGEQIRCRIGPARGCAFSHLPSPVLPAKHHVSPPLLGYVRRLCASRLPHLSRAGQASGASIPHPNHSATDFLHWPTPARCARMSIRSRLRREQGALSGGNFLERAMSSACAMLSL